MNRERLERMEGDLRQEIALMDRVRGYMVAALGVMDLGGSARAKGDTDAVAQWDRLVEAITKEMAKAAAELHQFREQAKERMDDQETARALLN